MKSVIQEQRECYITGRRDTLECHHIFRGVNRSKSEKYGLKVWLIKQLHDPSIKGSVHADPKGEINQMLLRAGQMAFERVHGDRAQFVKIFGRNWLDGGAQC
jgi:hypothetical protein